MATVKRNIRVRNTRRTKRAPGELPPLLRVPREEKPLWKRLLYVGGAVLAFIVGIFGWLVPVITGIPFYVLGLIFLAMASNRTLEWINSAETRLSPKWRKKLRGALKRIPIKGFRDMVAKPT